MYTTKLKIERTEQGTKKDRVREISLSTYRPGEKQQNPKIRNHVTLTHSEPKNIGEQKSNSTTNVVFVAKPISSNYTI